MDSPERIQYEEEAPAVTEPGRREGSGALPETTTTFHDRFVEIFDAHFRRLYRYVSRLSGEPELARDVAQEAFVKLYERGSLPDSPEAWLISVAMNLFRNVKTTRSRRLRLLDPIRGEQVQGDPPASPEETVAAEASRRHLRIALDHLPERERRLLLLRAEGYRYRDIAEALGLNEASVGVFLARARRAFKKSYEDAFDAP